jgi:2Fe-2S ferredoxin
VPTVVFIHSDDCIERHPVAVGDSVMDCALDNDVSGIKAQCGGGCTCSTCHCDVDSLWVERLSPQHPDEVELLSYVDEARENSRLSCQIIMSDDLDGIVVHVPAAD